MLTRRSASTSLAPLAMGVALFGLTGCGIGVGDHVFYRVAVDPTVRDAGCYQNNMIPDSIRDDKTNLAGSTTFILYITGDEKTKLDTGAFVVTGSETDTGYKFAGQLVDVDYPGTGITTTRTENFTLNMTIDGATMSGSSKSVITNTCVGSNCGNFDTTPCTETNVFKGVEMDSAEVVVANSAAPKP